MNIQFKKVFLHNFYSYADTEVELQNNGFCLVSGKNKYVLDRALSNGSGKSTIFTAICYALTGETIQGMTNNLKNTKIDDDSCYVTLTFSVDSDDYEITRYFKPKSDLVIYRNSENVSGKGIRESEKILAELLPDLTKDLIASTIIIGQGMPNKFSSFSPVGRKQLLESLTKSDYMIDDIKNRLSKRQSELSTQLQTINDSILINKTKLAETQAQLTFVLTELQNLQSPQYDSQILNCEKLLENYNNTIKDCQDNIQIINEETTLLTEKVVAASTQKSTDFATINTNYNEKLSVIKSAKIRLETEISALKNEIKRLESVSDICPTCGQKLIGVEKPDTTEQKRLLSEKEQQLNEYKDELDKANIKYNEYIQQIENTFEDQTSEIKTKLANNKNQTDNYTKVLTEAQGKQLQVSVEKARLEDEKLAYNSKLKNLSERQTTLESAIQSLQTAINLSCNAKQEIEEKIAVDKKIETLVKRDFRGYLLSDVINYIDQKAKEYSEIVFGTRDLNVYLDGNALDISIDGKMFDGLSGGEKQRVDLILQFAIRDLLQTYLNYSSNILVLDEVTDFLDKVSCEAIMTLITDKLKDIESVFIISHHPDELDIPVDSELKIIKNENGISEIYY